MMTTTSSRVLCAVSAAFAMIMQAIGPSMGFSLVPLLSSASPRSARSFTRRFLSDDQPSDTSSDPFYDDYDDEIVTVESVDFTPTESETLVTSILDLMPELGVDASEETRSQINEILLKLETLNPTEDPALSPLLNGVWELRYAGLYTSDGALGAFSPTRQLALFVYSGGYSPGVFALELASKLPSQLVSVGALDITISRAQPRVEGKVQVNSALIGESSVSVKSKLDVVSAVRLRETYESATVLGQQIELPEFARYSRELYVTYVDEDLLVVRDGSGVPELLVRKEKIFTRNWGTEPISVDDELAPGEE
ncbi:plastid lipid-associated PAP/fibrillin family protein [Nitzschia inconspicua]|uniref:Plastid lipid-associated PAP/fibrillin family protein n=1 Tax=Nitzschia inconspicua TaxID=303405 RepID=A0A9K3PFF5_9STRA|nr:plastid lipid-associated PAP/fibrillin family protein [Nitzschia inconspicua]